MTDNQKRAHDFATHTLIHIVEFRNAELIRNASTNATITAEALESGIVNIKGTDMYKEYLNIYNTVLKAFDRDFPEGK